MTVGEDGIPITTILTTITILMVTTTLTITVTHTALTGRTTTTHITTIGNYRAQRLAAVAADRNRPQKHAERAGVVLASAAGGPVQHVAALLVVSRPMVRRWQQRSSVAEAVPIRR